MGCGSGEKLIEMAFTYRTTKFYCTDPFEEALDKTREYCESLQLSNIEFVKYNEFLNDFDAVKFDIITSTRPVQHFENLNEVLSKLSSLLKPKGVLLLANWTGEHPEEILFNYENKNVKFAREYSQEEVD